jgi:hypothetical protein
VITIALLADEIVPGFHRFTRVLSLQKETKKSTTVPRIKIFRQVPARVYSWEPQLSGAFLESSFTPDRVLITSAINGWTEKLRIGLVNSRISYRFIGGILESIKMFFE